MMGQLIDERVIIIIFNNSNIYCNNNNSNNNDNMKYIVHNIHTTYSIHIYFHISIAGSEMGAAGDQAKKCVEKPGNNWEDHGSFMDFGDLLS